MNLNIIKLEPDTSTANVDNISNPTCNTPTVIFIDNDAQSTDRPKLVTDEALSATSFLQAQTVKNEASNSLLLPNEALRSTVEESNLTTYQLNIDKNMQTNYKSSSLYNQSQDNFILSRMEENASKFIVPNMTSSILESSCEPDTSISFNQSDSGISSSVDFQTFISGAQTCDSSNSGLNQSFYNYPLPVTNSQGNFGNANSNSFEYSRPNNNNPYTGGLIGAASLYSIEHLTANNNLSNIGLSNSSYNPHHFQNAQYAMQNQSNTSQFQPFFNSLISASLPGFSEISQHVYANQSGMHANHQNELTEYAGVKSFEEETNNTSETASDAMKTFRDKKKLKKSLKLPYKRIIGFSNKTLNRRAINVMEGWYSAHSDHPYPSHSEKMLMSNAGGISQCQVASWFANRRNRTQNTRPKQNKRKLIYAIKMVCNEIQESSQGLINAADVNKRLLDLINIYCR